MTELLGILVVALGIGMLIFVHELGHYLCARIIGVRVVVFSLGFGPRLLGFRRGGTDYRLCAVPLGGYVRVAGEDYVQRDYLPEDHLHAKGLAARTLFFSGGVVMNLLFALVAFPLVFHSGVRFTAPEVGVVSRGSPAWESGLQSGDRFLSIDGKEMYSWENAVTELALAGDSATLRLLRGDREMTVVVHPRYTEGRGLRSIGIGRPIAPRAPAVTVTEGGAAAQAGLRDGDVLVSIDGQPLMAAEFPAALAEVEGDRRPLAIGFLRDGQARTVRVEPAPSDSTPYLIGVVLARREVIGLRPYAAIERLGLARGDVILDVDGVPFYGENNDLLAEGGDRLQMTVLREGVERVLVLEDTTAAERRALADNLAVGTLVGDLLVVPQSDGPAAAAGVQAGDEVRAIDGVSVSQFDDLQQAVLASEGRTLSYTLARGGQEFQVPIAARRSATLGVAPVLEVHRQLFKKDTLGSAIGAGMVCSVDLIKQLYVTLKRIITGDVSARNLGGIITISRVTYQSSQWGAAYFFYFLALLSINLAFINVLPIPVLDGGHLMFVLIERIKGSPVSATVLNYSQILGLVFVLALIVFVTYNDILRLL